MTEIPLKIEVILVPIDFSATSEKALRYAVMMARSFRARIVLLHVVTPLPYPVDMAWVPGGVQLALGPARKKLALLEKECIPEANRKPPVVRSGVPHEVIADYARRAKVDLVVMGTHGHSDLAHIFMGSTAERVVRHARCPVLVVRR